MRMERTKPARGVVVFGYDDAAIATLDVLEAVGARTLAVVVPSNRRGSKLDALVRAIAARDLPVLTQPPRRDVEKLRNDLGALAPDLFVVWSYPMILPEALLHLPRLGSVNLHGGLLPSYRGGHVLQWAIINGETETGVTLHYIDAGIDTGPIVGCEKVPIGPDDDAAVLREQLIVAGGRLLARWWPDLATGTAPHAPQNSASGRYYPLRTIEDGRIDWFAPAPAIRNLVRALVPPWPGAFTFLRKERVIVYRASVSDEGRRLATPGSVVAVGERGISVATGDGLLWLSEVFVQGDGGSRLPIEVAAGERFGDL